MTLQVSLRSGENLLLLKEEKLKFYYPDLYRFGTTGVPSFIHSLFFCLFSDFQTARINDEPCALSEIVRGSLSELSLKFSKKDYYNLSNGRINTFSQDGDKKFSFEFLKESLKTFQNIPACLLQFLQEFFNVQIFIFDINEFDIYLPYDPSFLYHSQYTNNVLLSRRKDEINGIFCYEFFALEVSDKYGEKEFITNFSNDSTLVNSILKRIEQIQQNKNEKKKIDLKHFSDI